MVSLSPRSAAPVFFSLPPFARPLPRRARTRATAAALGVGTQREQSRVQTDRMAPAVAGGVVAYEDIFEVIDRDPDGKKFDKVSRFRCRSQFEAELQIDINVDIYNLEVRIASSHRDRTLSEPRFPLRPQPHPRCEEPSN